VLVLLRHGESTANAAGLLTGRGDVPLTAHGERQAARLGGCLGAVRALRSSPLGRARATAAALGVDRQVELDDRWVEVDYGELDGVPLTDVPAGDWSRWRTDPGHRPPGGETMREVFARVAPACEELFCAADRGARARDGDVVVVSHVSPIKCAVAWALGAGPELVWRLHLSTGSLTRLSWTAGRVVLLTYNEVPAAFEGAPGA
jgi:broad specificity phosphatase PhoE